MLLRNESTYNVVGVDTQKGEGKRRRGDGKKRRGEGKKRRGEGKKRRGGGRERRGEGRGGEKGERAPVHPHNIGLG